MIFRFNERLYDETRVSPREAVIHMSCLFGEEAPRTDTPADNELYRSPIWRVEWKIIIVFLQSRNSSASSLFGVGNLGDHGRVVLDGQTRRAASESPILVAFVAVSLVPRRPAGCTARGKKPKEGVWGNLRSWFPQIARTDSAEEPKR